MDINELENQSASVDEDVTKMPGLTATMEIAGAESIPNANPDKIILGFARED